MQANLGFHLDHPRGDLDEAQSQGVELRDGKTRALRHRGAQAPHQPVGAGMQEQPELVGGRACAGRAVGGEMRLPGLDVVLGRAAPAVDILVERLGLSAGEVGDDEAAIGPLGADLDPGDDALDAAPTGGPVNELLEPADLARFRRRFEASRRAGLQVRDMLAQGRGGCQAEDEVDVVGAAPVNDQRTAVMSVGSDQDAGVRPVAQSRARGGAGERGSQPHSAAWPVATPR